MDEYNNTLKDLTYLLEQAAREVENARRQRIVKIVNVNRDDWAPPTEPVHECGANCDDLACEVTVAEIEAAHRKAKYQVDWLNRFMPLPKDSNVTE